MKNLLYTLTILFTISISNFAQAQIQQTLVKNLAVKDYANAIADLKGNITVEEWEGTSIRIQTTISVENVDESILKKLIVLGRYSVQTEERDGQLFLHMPKAKKTIVIKSVELKENYQYTISVPRGFEISQEENNQDKV